MKERSSFRSISSVILIIMLATNMFLIYNLALTTTNVDLEHNAMGQAAMHISGFTQIQFPTFKKKEEEDVMGRLVEELVEWSISKGGYFHPNVEIRRFDPSDPTSFFGAFVNGPVGVNETLIKIPGSIKLQLSKETKHGLGYESSVCELAWLLKEEYDKGNSSEYLPYINYVKEQSFGQIPAMWSPSGQHLLLRVQGDLFMVDDNGFVNPSRMTKWIDRYYETKCLNPRDEENEYLNPFFVAMAIQRGYDKALIPIYDMLNSHEGKINSITRPSIYDRNGFGVYALQDLDKGDELFYSYYHCPDCGHVPWGTPEMLRDFGYVEQYPQTFYLDDNMILYVDQDGQGGYKAWCKEQCPPKAWVQKQLEYLQRVDEDDIATATPYIPEKELNIIRQYHEALTIAFTAVLPIATENDSVLPNTTDDASKRSLE
ncbi:unnamed protein product [Cylindrotheca closterium]|uniref:SET domain-containing protein n=1 Tax=Cylindrotheca closterium TaxID=2856 RepID=A0AAD2CUX1_9STRA|nr:unnamed protein product [Cylindrotheca closterium]